MSAFLTREDVARLTKRTRYTAQRRVLSRLGYQYDVAADGEPHPLTGSRVVLTTAHVHDDRPEASSLLNLAALCQRCHNRHDMAARRAGTRERARAHTADLFAVRAMEGEA